MPSTDPRGWTARNDAMSRFRVLLVDDYALSRTGMRLLLQGLPGVEVVAEASNGREALELAQIHRPNLVITDIAMKGLTGLEITARLKAQSPEVRVVVLSMYTGEEYVLRALQAGASAYVLKGSAAHELDSALRAIARGETYLSPPLSKQAVADYMRRLNTKPRSGRTPAPR